ncbi:MAG: methyltransferase domain-containing protein [Chloroflexi bacterium]|nr:methyltransferase domain-containing protein [Chloroflexota bacterium]
MMQKPNHLAPSYGAQFKDQSVVNAYHNRPAYPEVVFDILTNLMPASSQRVLDVGCGTGYLARPLTSQVAHIDAVDFSAHMIAQGKTLPNGNAANLTWIEGAVEEVPLTPPYGLITAGESLHWMAWEIVLPRFHTLLAPNAYLAIVSKRFSTMPWQAELGDIIAHFSTNQEFEPYNLVDELVQRGLFEKLGEQVTAPITHQQTVDTYIESFHSSNGFSRDRMTSVGATGFDTAVRDLITPYCPDNQMEIQVSGQVIWGIPQQI